MEKELKMKVLSMLDEAKTLAVEGKKEEAAKKIEEAKKEIEKEDEEEPIPPTGGTGSNGLMPVE